MREEKLQSLSNFPKPYSNFLNLQLFFVHQLATSTRIVMEKGQESRWTIVNRHGRPFKTHRKLKWDAEKGNGRRIKEETKINLFFT